MGYVKQGFKDGDILYASQLIKIEQAIQDSEAEIAKKGEIVVFKATISEKLGDSAYTLSLLDSKTYEDVSSAIRDNKNVSMDIAGNDTFLNGSALHLIYSGTIGEDIEFSSSTTESESISVYGALISQKTFTLIVNVLTSSYSTTELELTQDAETNRALLQNTFDNAGEYSTIRLKGGKYPVPFSTYTKNQYNNEVIVTPRPTIRKTGVVFDMNGSCLYGVTNGTDKHGLRSIICVAGKDITVKNGELVGTFDSPREKGPNGTELNFYEGESVLSLEEFNYTNCKIENMTIRNARGYGLTGSDGLYQDTSLNTDLQIQRFYYTGGTEGEDQLIRNYNEAQAQKGMWSDDYSTPSITIPTGYKYIMVGNARDGNAFRISSSFPAVYEFTIGEGDTATKQYIHETPNNPIHIPDGAKSVIVTVGFAGTDLPYTENNVWSGSIATRRTLTVMFMQHGLGVSINNCFFRNNSSLGCAAGLGVWEFSNCRSAYNSFYRDVIEGFEGTTVGMLDVEEFPTAELRLINCHSEGERNLALVCSYKTYITGCTGDRRGTGGTGKQIDLGGIIISGGWEAFIDNCRCPIQTNKETICNISNCYVGYTVNTDKYERTNWKNCCFDSLDWSREPRSYDTVAIYKGQGGIAIPPKNFIIKNVNSAVIHIMNNASTIPNSIIAVGTLYVGTNTQYKGIRIYANNYRGVGSNHALNKFTMSNVLKVGGHSYYIESDVPVFPNNFDIIQSSFVSGIRDYACSLEENVDKGRYIQCRFHVSENSSNFLTIVRATLKPFELTFQKCLFICPQGKKLFTKGNISGWSQTFSSSCKFNFTDCTLNGAKLIDASQLAPFIDEDSQAVIIIS